VLHADKIGRRALVGVILTARHTSAEIDEIGDVLVASLRGVDHG
jgi:hypothetical protein